MTLDNKDINVALEGLDAFGAPSAHMDADFDWSFAGMDPLSMSVGTATTVSPKDIWNDPFGSSAPPSTAFTNLTSPSINESPYIGDGYETSPLFQQDSDMDSQCWPSLFPEDKPAPTAPLVLTTASGRRKSSNGGSPTTSYSGVSKPRRRKGPLPPISVDPSDKIALKRARNTLAARDSRQRKFDHVQTLEKRIAELEQEKKEAAAEIEKWKALALSLGALPPQ
ncbi:uncharacterized protein K452DRAFT_264567 [Aplosporella prunicola CBS 121167]|uniref:BZIP domain-containing protein n=1 Tax=Aplosporella prunicola CBS 121167 TaxID=1176127 RepID=A0A6A6BRQ3_9PEZI|nr:uncharacterized protein K452DRAFT_264567 [Aplosporella prunicola CBS 121167]KAF2145497.1 hypothetical protein K452DRAFT_264567 [Aplosporella prunicola CBS 121167]